MPTKEDYDNELNCAQKYTMNNKGVVVQVVLAATDFHDKLILYTLVADDDRPSLETEWNRGEHFTYEILYTFKNGKLIWSKS